VSGGHIGDSAKVAAKDAGIGHGTLRRVKKVMEDGSEGQKQDLLRGVSANKLHNQVMDEENKNQVKKKLEAGQELTDQEILVDLGIKFNPVTVWTFQRRNTSFGREYTGSTPMQLVVCMLYWFTKQGDLIVDPMAGGGVVGDVCAIMKRKCKMYDVKPHKERNDIEKF
jgi:DNA modification methylase